MVGSYGGGISLGKIACGADGQIALRSNHPGSLIETGPIMRGGHVSVLEKTQVCWTTLAGQET
jgi:hypothetical protein